MIFFSKLFNSVLLPDSPSRAVTEFMVLAWSFEEYMVKRGLTWLEAKDYLSRLCPEAAFATPETGTLMKELIKKLEGDDG